MIAVERLALDALTPDQAAGWERLIAQRERAALFVTPDWLGAWLAELGGGWTPLLLRAVEDGATLAVAPFGLAPRRVAFTTLAFLGGGTSDYLAPLADPARGAAGVDACLAALLDRCAPSWDLLDLAGLPADSPTPRALACAARARGLLVDVLPGYRCPELAIRGDWAGYLRARGGHFRHWLRSKRKRLERLGDVRFRHIHGGAEFGPALDAAMELHAARWRGRATSTIFSSAAAGRRFYRRAGDAYARRGWLDLALLELDGRAIAFALSLQHGDTYAYLVPAHDPAYDRHSPGGLLLAHLLEQAHGRGMRRFDFMLGEEDYKYQWADHEHHTLRLLAARPTPRGRLALAVARGQAHLRGRLRRSRLARQWRDRLARLRAG